MGPTMRATAGSDPHLQSNAVGQPDDLVRAMTAVLARQRPQSVAEALRMLRRGYPDIPLSMRIAAMCAGGK